MSIKLSNIVPSRELAAASRNQIAIATPATMPIVRVGGPIGACFTRWHANRESTTYRALAESARAQSDFVNARSDLARSYLTAARAISELRELPDILEHDAKVRQALRDRELDTVEREAAEARYGFDATRDEINELRAKQRKRVSGKEHSALRALTKAKIELEALGRDTTEIEQAMTGIVTK